MKLPLSAIVERWSGSLVIVGKLSDKGPLIGTPPRTAPQLLKRAEFEADWIGCVVLMARRHRWRISEAASTSLGSWARSTSTENYSERY